MKTTLRAATLLLCPLLSHALAAQGDTGAEAGAGSATIPRPPGLEAIQAAELKGWASYLAADELGGRLTGSAGQELAAKYIADHFKTLGLEPLGDEVEGARQRSYLQRYPLTRTRVDPEKSWFELAAGTDGAGGELPAVAFREGFAVIPGKGAKAGVSAKVDFVYGGLVRTRRFIKGTEPEDWTGKVPVLVIKHAKSDRKFRIEQQMMTGTLMLASLKNRVGRYASKGAPAVVVCVLDDASAAANMLTYMSIAPGQDLMTMKGSFGMGMMMRNLRSTVPTVFLSAKLARPLLARIGLSMEAANQQVPAARLGELRRPTGQVQVTVDENQATTASNVVAVLRGSDPELRHEAVIYSAHMDHVGRRMDGDVFNGADDNASGTAGLMAIAKAFATSAGKPKRSIIFLSVSGEELGLWGSAYYARNPTWPVEDLVANINTDMIGRSGPESGARQVTVTPSYKHPKFSTIVETAARLGKQLGLEFENGDKYYQRSDHYNFARVGVPVVFFCNGEHEDYHQVSDHPEKLDGDKMQLIARLAYWTGYRVANAADRPETLGRSASWLR